MLVTALKILDSTHESIYDDVVMGLAGELHTRRHELDDNQFSRYLYIYSAHLASKVADKVAIACLSEDEYNQMTDSVVELDDMTDSVIREVEEDGK